MIKEFKKFITRGNVLDLAVAVIIGGAFGKIVSSLVTDILMPPLGLLLGSVDFSNLYINLSGTEYSSLAEAKAAGAATINYGLFINNVIDFLIVGFAIFLIVRSVNRVSEIKRIKEAEKPKPAEKECPFCLSKIPVKAKRCAYCTSLLEDS